MHFNGRICISRQGWDRRKLHAMKIAKPLLLVSTPLGMVTGLIEAYRLVGGLAILMFAMMAMLGIAAAGVVYTIKKEKREWTASKSSS
jgi:predicted exporter